MLCKYLNDIYADYIHPNLLENEIGYSIYYQNMVLDLWNSCTHIGIDKMNDITYYIRDSDKKILFKVYNNSNRIGRYDHVGCNYKHVYCFLAWKKKLWFNLSSHVISKVISKELNRQVEPYHAYYEEFPKIHRLKLKLKDSE